MYSETINTIVIYQCSDCNAEISRKEKLYNLEEFKLLNNLQPNLYFQDAGTKEYFIVVKIPCDTCCDNNIGRDKHVTRRY